MQSAGPFRGRVRHPRGSTGDSLTIVLGWRAEIIDKLAAQHGEGFVHAAREALQRKDLFAVDQALIALGYKL